MPNMATSSARVWALAFALMGCNTRSFTTTADGSESGCGCPTAQLPIGSGVCGKDGQTYESACLAACAGTTIADGCKCGRPAGSVCGCTHQTDLICGSDGQTWTSACIASWAKVGVVSVGACGTGAQHGTLPLNATCDGDHDLCGEGLKCCVASPGFLPPDMMFTPPPPSCQMLVNGACPMSA